MEIKNEGCSAVYFYLVPLIYVAGYVGLGVESGVAGGIAAGIIIGVLSLIIYVFFIVERQKSLAFLLFLSNNTELLAEGNTIEYKNIKLNMQSELRYYESCITFFLPWPGGIKTNSSYYIKGYHKTWKPALMYTLGSFLFGWLAVWTVVWIFSTAFTNIIGGKRLNIEELISENNKIQEQT